MLYFKIIFISYYCYNVKTNLAVQAETPEISIRRRYDSSDFLCVDSILRHCVCRIFTAFYFHNNKIISFFCHNVQFFASTSLITVPDVIAVFN